MKLITDIAIAVNQNIIEWAYEKKIGIIIDDKLSWKAHTIGKIQIG